MLKVAAAVLILSAVSPKAAPGQHQRDRSTINEIVRSILATRSVILRDTMPLDFCEWRDAFDSTGTLPGAPPAYLRMRMHVPLSECDRPRPQTTSVPSARVRSVRFVGDTTVVETLTDRLYVTYWDEYRCARAGPHMDCKYLLLGWMQK